MSHEDVKHKNFKNVTAANGDPSVLAPNWAQCCVGDIKGDRLWLVLQEFAARWEGDIPFNRGDSGKWWVGGTSDMKMLHVQRREEMGRMEQSGGLHGRGEV